MSTWTKQKLSEICDVRDGTHDSPKPATTGLPLVTSKHIINSRVDLSQTYLITKEDYESVNRRSKVDQFDLLISMIGTVGEIAFIKEKPQFAIKNVGLVKTKSEMLGRYLFYYLLSPVGKNNLNSLLSGSTQKFISLGKLRDLQVTFPPDEIKKNITSVLSSYDDLIENNEKRIKTLEQMAELLYTEWFVKFKFPGNEKIKLADSGTSYGKIPEGWEVVTIESLLGKVKRKPKIPAGEYLKTGVFPIVDQGREFIAGYTNDESAVYNEDLIVFGDHSRCFKYCNFPFACGADGTQLLLTNDRERMPEILLYYFAKNSGLQNFNYARHFKFLKSLQVLKPTKVIARSFSNFVDSAYLQIESLQNRNINLSKTRDLLIPQLITGKRELKNI